MPIGNKVPIMLLTGARSASFASRENMPSGVTKNRSQSHPLGERVVSSKSQNSSHSKEEPSIVHAAASLFFFSSIGWCAGGLYHLLAENDGATGMFLIAVGVGLGSFGIIVIKRVQHVDGGNRMDKI